MTTIRINLLRDRRAERFAKVLAPEPDLWDLVKEIGKPGNFSHLPPEYNGYTMFVHPETFKHLKEMPMMEHGKYKGVRVIETTMMPKGKVSMPIRPVYKP